VQFGSNECGGLADWVPLIGCLGNQDGINMLYVYELIASHSKFHMLIAKTTSKKEQRGCYLNKANKDFGQIKVARAKFNNME